MNTVMAAQENMALVRSQFDLYNNRQSDPAWLDKIMAAFAADAEDVDVPSGAMLHGPDGHKRLVLFFAENFPDMRVELSNAFATEDQVTLEGAWCWKDISPLYLPSGALPSMRRSGKLRFCSIFQIRNGKIASHHAYYDMLTLMEQLGLAPATRQATW
jgi:predicted ester cyclase